jgi:hypothetical protein
MIHTEITKSTSSINKNQNHTEITRKLNGELHGDGA